jgi:hypothetical protein
MANHIGSARAAALRAGNPIAKSPYPQYARITISSQDPCMASHRRMK